MQSPCECGACPKLGMPQILTSLDSDSMFPKKRVLLTTAANQPWLQRATDRETGGLCRGTTLKAYSNLMADPGLGFKTTARTPLNKVSYRPDLLRRASVDPHTWALLCNL